MSGGILPANYKVLSVFRRIGELGRARWLPVLGVEGSVGVFQFPEDATPIIVEAVSGRSMAIVPGDIFLATPGYRESVRWVVGGMPKGGLVPGEDYWVLSESGVMGALVADSPLPIRHMGKARYLGAVLGAGGEPLHLRDFMIHAAPDATDAGAPVYLLIGTSSEVGKTTAGLTLLRTLLSQGHDTILVLKATGTSSITELATYQDFGASAVFDCVDFGIPTTTPSGRADALEVFGRALNLCLSLPADALLVECGGDLLGSSVPEFIECLRTRRSKLTTILAAWDPYGALGAKQALDGIGLKVDLITGPCTDTSISLERTSALCGVAARSMRS
ncbi:MAG TPA: hypothetical protein VKT26_07305 [Acetobacteraceae bacterium]|nr:hypothetical protein [Acetobacteraceae bacterium]